MLIRNKPLSGYNTTICPQPNGNIIVTYYKTQIVKVFSKSIELDNGGYITHTTKKKMNQVSEQLDLGFKVFQRGLEWFVSLPNSDKSIPFQNGKVTFNR